MGGAGAVPLCTEAPRAEPAPEARRGGGCRAVGAWPCSIDCFLSKLTLMFPNPRRVAQKHFSSDFNALSFSHIFSFVCFSALLGAVFDASRRCSPLFGGFP